MKRVFVFLFASCAVSAMAQVPIGTFHYAFTNATLWDATGIYITTNTSDGFTDEANLDVTVAANGAVTGTRADRFIEVATPANFTVIDGTLTGKVSGKAGVVAGKLKETGTCSGALDGFDFTGTAKGSATVSFDTNSSAIISVGTWKVSADHKSETHSGTETNALPAGVNGDWRLDTDITGTNADKLAGTGTLTLSNDRTFTYTIIGSYSTKNDVAKLKLVGGTNAVGSSLSMTTTGTNMVLTTLKGKVLGQSPTFTAP